jgi:mannose-1-phosphate guanylyltransferase
LALELPLSALLFHHRKPGVVTERVPREIQLRSSMLQLSLETGGANAFHVSSEFFRRGDLMGTHAESMDRCGIVLAGGDGTRLSPFVQQLKGFPLPKQYVNFIGTRSMLEHTFDRAEKVIPPGRLFTVITRNHLAYKETQRQISRRPRGTVVIQPSNRDTGPGVLLPLMRLHKHYPNSSVAIFPSDHFIQEEDLFALYVGLALRLTEQDPSRVILLGVEPNEPDPEYGYILPKRRVPPSDTPAIQNVDRFVEKPGPAMARQLLSEGALWNTMILMANSKTLLDLIGRMMPEVFASFTRIQEAMDSPDEAELMTEIYASLQPANFSRALLETLPCSEPDCLSVLSMSGICWSDWGSTRRLMNVLDQTGYAARLPARMDHRLCKHGIES